MASGNAEEVLFVNFNQDYSSLAVGTRKGYRLYAVNSVDDFPNIHQSDVEDVCIVERLFSSSLVTLVSQSAPRKLHVAHFQKGTEICSHSYSNTLLSVHLNRLRVVVVLEESIYIHNIRDMKVLHTIRDTPPNPLGLASLSPSDSSFLAYPASATAGELHIFDAQNLTGLAMISAHEGPLAALKLSEDGTRLATASDKGTVIRVFGVPAGERLFEFRRGVKRQHESAAALFAAAAPPLHSQLHSHAVFMDMAMVTKAPSSLPQNTICNSRCVTIYSLAFSKDCQYLASTSNTETIHVFRLDEAHRHVDEEAAKRSSISSAEGKGWMDFVSSTAASYLPAQMTEVFQQERSFATAHLPSPPGTKSVCAILTLKQAPRLVVATADGYLYIFNLERGETAELTLLKQHRLMSEESPSTVTRAERTTSGSGGGTGSGEGASYAAHADPGRRPPPSPEETLKREVAEVTEAAESGLRLSDSHEFPPMTHTAD